MPRRVQKYRDEGNIWEEEIEYSRRRHRKDNEHPKAPLMLRVLTWTGIVLLCFVGGYLGTSWGIKFLNQRPWENQENNPVASFDVTNMSEQGLLDVKKLTINLYYPQGGKLISEDFELISDVKEQEIKGTIEKLFSVSKMFTKEVLVKNIFRNVTTLHINITGPFIPKLSEAGKEQSTLFLNGLVRTMTENFLPINEVRFLINGSVTSAGSPVDLTIAWK